MVVAKKEEEDMYLFCLTKWSSSALNSTPSNVPMRYCPPEPKATLCQPKLIFKIHFFPLLVFISKRL